MMKTEADLVAAGYKTWEGQPDAFETMTGPFYLREDEDGVRCAFVSEAKHCNAHGMLHGGLLMTFADFSLFAFARKVLDGACVTVGFNAEFISAGKPDALVEATGEVVRATRSLLFVRGMITSGDATLLSFSGILKKLKS